MISESMVNLDVREEIRSGNDPFTRIMKTVATLKADQKLRVIAPFKPTPLLAIMTSKGFAHHAQPFGQSGDWEVVFELAGSPLTDMAAPGARNQAEAACQVVPTMEVDARGLEPPEPMMRILEALATLPQNTAMKARTDRRPLHLQPHLEERGFRGVSEEQPDGSYVTTIRFA